MPSRTKLKLDKDAQTEFRWTCAIASLAWFAFALERLVVITELPVIRADLQASPSDLEWTVNGYTLTFAVLVLTGAALGDRFGRRCSPSAWPRSRWGRRCQRSPDPSELDLPGAALGSTGLLGWSGK